MPFRNRPATPDEALARLLEGNRRFVDGAPRAPVPSAERIELASGQNPFAVVLGCSDSRVPIETIFDQQPGDLFVVRIAGNFVSDDGLASIEYAIAVLSCELVVVLGHTACGAVQAALQSIEDGTRFQGHIQRLADAIAPAANRARTLDGDWYDNAIIENVRDSASSTLGRSDIVSAAVKGGLVRVVGARYDLRSGQVHLVE
jgi:carbonic anhydrase